ncbi:MAG: SDR family oxidoreductase [Thermodesulfobacteriota bacterium]
MTKYLVTGGAGFIGSNIVRKLLKEKKQVRVIDNLSTGKKENLLGVLSQIEFIQGELTHLPTVKKAVDGIEYVLHQGAIPSVPRSIEDPLKSTEANVIGTLNLLVASRESEVKRVVYASSSSIYGDTPTLPKIEGMSPLPKSPYAVSKLAGEHYCQVFYHIYGLETVCLRYFNIFGPHQDPNSHYAAVIPKFISAILNRIPPIVYGDGLQSRDFTYVYNAVKANLQACEAEGVGGEVFNIACGERYNMVRLIEVINSITGTNINPIHQEPRKGDVKHSLADISKAKKLLGYNPIVDFEEGIKRTISFYQNGKEDKGF